MPKLGDFPKKLSINSLIKIDLIEFCLLVMYYKIVSYALSLYCRLFLDLFVEKYSCEDYQV